MLRPGDEAQGSEAASFLGLTPSEILLVNARVLRPDPRLPPARSVAIQGGRIVAVGNERTLRRLVSRRAPVIDCRGGTLLPGLIDPHLHLFALAARAVHLDCGALRGRRVSDLLARVRALAEHLPSGAWVRGEGLDEARLERLPTPAELDHAALGHPVRLRHRSRHASLLSTRALTLSGARGLVTERRTGRATGLVYGREEALSQCIGPLDATVLARGFEETARELASYGVTTVADATPRAHAALAPLRAAVADGRFPLRVYAMRPVGASRWKGRPGLAPGPIKLMVHDEPAGLRPSPFVLARQIRRAAQRGDQVAVHCVSVATLVAALAGFAALPATLRQGRRHRLEHLAECPPPLVPRIAALGLAVVSNPAFVYWRGDAYRREGGRWLYRAASLAAAGIVVAGASDAPVVPPNPWRGIVAARSRRTRDDHVVGGHERLTARAALGLFTTAAAYVLGADDLGCLVPGAAADITVIDADPLRAPVAELAATTARLTIAAGRVVWAA